MINEANFLKLMDLVYRKSGVRIDIRKFTTLAPKIEALLGRFNYPDFRSFFHDLRFTKSHNLLQELMNVITVNETYFFREKYQFESLVYDILPHLHTLRPPGEPLRILCAPSSTGEEPYSIALSLIEEEKLLENRDIEIIGIDIDSTVIRKAQQGFYSPRSVQFVPKTLLAEYFTSKNGGYEIAPFLRNAITFKVLNVMDRYALRRLGKFDIVFCRNMLIYFDDISRKEVAMGFYEILKHQGVVFLGHAESMNRIVSVFKTAKSRESIYYIKE